MLTKWALSNLTAATSTSTPSFNDVPYQLLIVSVNNIIETSGIYMRNLIQNGLHTTKNALLSFTSIVETYHPTNMPFHTYPDDLYQR